MDDRLVGAVGVELSLVTVDLAIFTIRGGELVVLLVERGTEPFAGKAALPGGRVRAHETLDAGARRELQEETSVSPDRLHLEQLGAYGAPGRDPRGRVITVAYLALGPDLPVPRGGTDAVHAYWGRVEGLLENPGNLAFDHDHIVADALERVRGEFEYTTVATAFCPEVFTLTELRRVYERVWGRSLDPSNFRRKATKADGFVEATGQQRPQAAGRPAALYRRGPARLLSPPFLRTADRQ
ncbi:NUDIX hydrolase [Nocardiopsis salina]|uniref:NUDIX hydrolase n=1 Tax=Nocardiopsis salina TaxID=245836 RepID=UPI0003497035|nr:NUDIX domain-containing protein [Nocardiopsis salina]